MSAAECAPPAVVFVGIITRGVLGYLADKTLQALIRRLAWRYAPTN